MDNILAAVLVSAFWFVVGGCLGAGFVSSEVIKDCQTMQQVRFNQTTFDCKERSK